MLSIRMITLDLSFHVYWILARQLTPYNSNNNECDDADDANDNDKNKWMKYSVYASELIDCIWTLILVIILV